jgi:hypothetical protein
VLDESRGEDVRETVDHGRNATLRVVDRPRNPFLKVVVWCEHLAIFGQHIGRLPRIAVGTSPICLVVVVVNHPFVIPMEFHALCFELRPQARVMRGVLVQFVPSAVVLTELVAAAPVVAQHDDRGVVVCQGVAEGVGRFAIVGRGVRNDALVCPPFEDVRNGLRAQSHRQTSRALTW